MPRLTLVIPMKPAAKARPRVTAHGTYTPEATVVAEEQIRTAWLAAWGWQALERWGKDTPLRLTVMVYLERPRTVRRPLPTSRPDLDNYAKLVMDSLNTVAYADDACVVALRCEKRYALPGSAPRVEVWLEECELNALEALSLGMISPARRTVNRRG